MHDFSFFKKSIYLFMPLCCFLFIIGCAGGTVLQSIAITPASPYTGIGLTESLTATATFSDGTTNDMGVRGGHNT